MSSTIKQHVLYTLSMPESADRRWRREVRYQARNVTLTPVQWADMEAEADAAGVSVSAVARDAIGRGLALVRDARRKRERNAARQAARQ